MHTPRISHAEKQNIQKINIYSFYKLQLKKRSSFKFWSVNYRQDDLCQDFFFILCFYKVPNMLSEFNGHPSSSFLNLKGVQLPPDINTFIIFRKYGQLLI